LTKKEKELQKLNALVDAAIEYELIYTAPEIVYDGFAPLKEHFLRQQKSAAAYFDAGNLPALKRLFQQLTAKLTYIADLQFVKFIEEKSGFEFKPFAGLEDETNRILNNGKIQNEEEKKSADLQLEIYKQTDPESKKISLLHELIIDYYEAAPPKENKPTWSKEIKREKVGDHFLVDVVSGTGPEPLIYESEMIWSPDDKRRLSITRQSIDGKSGYTLVGINFTRASINIYQVDELNSNIKANWKDNNTVRIQTQRNINAVVQYKTVQSFDEVINIEYINEKGLSLTK